MSEIFEVFIEIPKGSRNKYEYDYERKAFKLDRTLYSPMHYPADYGYIPNTLGLDGDALDVLVPLCEPTFPGCLIDVKPVAVLIMSDDKGEDEKILCAPVNDPHWNHLNDIGDVSEHLLKEIAHFFQVYKDLENKETKIVGWKGKETALKLIEEGKIRYQDSKKKNDSTSCTTC